LASSKTIQPQIPSLEKEREWPGWNFSRVLARDVAKDQEKPYWEKKKGNQ
jgi:hypothetical protein